MKIILALVFECDSTDWAHEYNLPEVDAARDFAAVLRRAVDDGGIRQAVDTSWPMMRGHTRVSTLDGLDATTRDELLHELRRARDGDRNAALVAEIRDHLATHRHDLDRREPRWVIFGTAEWDNGHFLTGSGATVYFAEGDHVAVDFDGPCFDDVLVDMYGARGSQGALGVDLRTATLTFDDYSDIVPDLLGIPANDHHNGDGCAIYTTDHTVSRDGVAVFITDLRDGDVFIDYDDRPWLAARVGRDGHDMHVDIEPAAGVTTVSAATPTDPGPDSPSIP